MAIIDYSEGDIVTEGVGVWLMVKDNTGDLFSVCLRNMEGVKMAFLNRKHPTSGKMEKIINIKSLVPILLDEYKASKE
jgi:hypothetical protein